MPDELKTQGTGSESSQGNDPSAKQQDPNNKTPEQKGQTGKEGEEKFDPSKQVVTPVILKGVMDSHMRTFRGELEKALRTSNEKIASLSKELETLQQGEDKSSTQKAKQQAPDNPELVDLRKRVKELEESRVKAVQAADEARRKERDYRFRTMVTDALVRNECRKPDRVFRMIAPDLQFDEEGNRIFCTVESEFGTRDMDVDEYVKTVVKEEVVPELFHGKMRSGSAAGGDDGTPDGKYQFTLKQIRNEKFYMEHADEIRKALEEKRVKLDE